MGQRNMSQTGNASSRFGLLPQCCTVQCRDGVRDGDDISFIVLLSGAFVWSGGVLRELRMVERGKGRE